MNKLRAFVAIDIPKNIQKAIKKIQEKLPDFNGKITEAENLHLTLKFLGWVPEEKIPEIKEQLKKIKLRKFETEIDSLGIFDNSKSGRYSRQIIAWLHMSNCGELQKQVDEKLSEFFEKEKRFMSHLTIARVKGVRDKKGFLEEIKRIKIEKISFPVKSFKLKKSVLTRNGPIYEDLEVYPLGQ